LVNKVEFLGGGDWELVYFRRNPLLFFDLLKGSFEALEASLQ
jgi:hypothetical protein